MTTGRSFLCAKHGCFARNLKKASLFCTKNAWKGALHLFWKESSSRSWLQDDPLEDPLEKLHGRF